MRKVGILLSLGLMTATASPAHAQSETIKDMGRSMHGPDDGRHCVDALSPLDKRIAFCRAAVREGHLQYNLTLAELDRLTGNFDEALAALAALAERLPERSPSSVSKRDEGWEPVLALRSQIYAQMGRFDDAKTDSTELERIGHREADSQENECLIRALANRELEQGLAACDKSVDRNAREDYLTSRGMIELRMGRLPDALKDFNAALDRNGHFAPALYGRGVIKAKLGDAAGAKDDMEAATRRNMSTAQFMAIFGVTP